MTSLVSVCVCVCVCVGFFLILGFSLSLLAGAVELRVDRVASVPSLSPDRVRCLSFDIFRSVSYSAVLCVCVCVCVGLLIWNPTESSRWEPGTNSKRNKKKRNNNRKINLRRDLTEFSPPRCGPLDFFLSGIVSNYEKLNSTECTLLLHPIQSLFRFEGSSAGSSGRLRRVLIQQWYRWWIAITGHLDFFFL